MRQPNEVSLQLEAEIRKARIPDQGRYYNSLWYVSSITLYDVIDLALYALDLLGAAFTYGELLHACASMVESKRGQVVCRILRIEQAQARLEKYFRKSFFYPTIGHEEHFFQSRDWKLHRLWIQRYVLPKFAIYRDQHRTKWRLAMATAAIIIDRIRANRKEVSHE